MSGQKNKINLLTVILIAIFILGIAYSLWYFITGWDQQNAIMAYCSTNNDTSLGWFQYVFGHGVLNFVAGFLAIYFIASPILFFLQSNDVNETMSTLAISGIAASIMVGFTVMLLYSGIFLISEQPLFSGLLIIAGIFSGLASCFTLVNIVFVKQ